MGVGLDAISVQATSLIPIRRESNPSCSDHGKCLICLTLPLVEGLGLQHSCVNRVTLTSADQESSSMAPWASKVMCYSEYGIYGMLYACILPLQASSDHAELAPHHSNLVYPNFRA